MAILVNVIEAKQGHVKEIEHEGVNYKLSLDYPQVGDIIAPHTKEWNFNPEGFYVCVSLDSDGDGEIELDIGIVDTHYRHHYDVYKRETGTSFSEIERRVDALDERLNAVEELVKGEGVSGNARVEVGDMVVALTKSECGVISVGAVGRLKCLIDYVEDPYNAEVESGEHVDWFRPQDLVKVVKRVGRVGERIVITEAVTFGDTYKNGDIFTVKGISDMGNTLVNEHWNVIYPSEYYVIERSNVPEKLSERGFEEGDIVVITGNTNASCNEVGDIGKITSKILNDEVSKWVDVPGRSGSGAYTLLEEMRHATEKEKAQYEDALSVIGLGDIVVITGNTNSSRNEIGDIGRVVASEGNDELSVWVDVPGRELRGNGAYTRFGQMRHATDEEKAQYVKALEATKTVKEFDVGDIVEVVDYNFGSPVGTLLKLTRVNGTSLKANDGYLYTRLTVKLICKAEDIVKEDE